MESKTSVTDLYWQRILSQVLGIYALVAGAISFGGWPFNIPRLTDWFNDGVSIQPNTAILIAIAGAAVLLLPTGYRWITLTLGGFVAFAGTANLLQYIVGADFGFNDELLFGRSWGQNTTVSPGRFGPPASISFILVGISLVLLSLRERRPRRYVPSMALMVVLLMMFSLFGYLFGARNFYAIPWLSAIALPTSTMLLALAVSLVVSVPERQPMLLLCEHSSAGAMARTVLPILLVMIPSVTWFRGKGYELALFDLGTGRALSAAVLVLGVVVLMWIALLALRRREQREREADRRKDEFLATLAHELRNPLAPISNATSLLKLSCEDRGVFQQATETIERQLGHLVRLIDDLLDMSRISRGKLTLRHERVELAPIINQAVETCRPMVASAKHDLRVTLPSRPVYLYADPVRLCQVVSNLLNNACKFVRQDGRISLSAECRDNHVLITVKDNGIGIPPDKINGIFEMFSQVDQSLERSQSGLGIGLTLAKRLVELHGGSIDARSEGLDKGSEFVVRLPVAFDRPPTPPQEPEDDVRPSGNLRILVVEDNRDSAESLAMLLRRTGNETSVAYDGEEAVEAAARQRPDVILLDIGLPRLNGFDVCRRIRKNSWAENILIIALTGWGQEEDRRKSADAGFDGHLVKPVDHGELTKLLGSQSSTAKSAATQPL
jgi:signal transduction histidine kinase/ActR/RegA family two-component response regulator